MGEIRIIVDEDGQRHSEHGFATIAEAVEHLVAHGFTETARPVEPNYTTRLWQVRTRLRHHGGDRCARIDTTSDVGCWPTIIDELRDAAHPHPASAPPVTRDAVLRAVSDAVHEDVGRRPLGPSIADRLGLTGEDRDGDG